MISNWRFILTGLILIAASGVAYALRPTPIIEVRDVDLGRQIPTSFAQWREVQTGLVQIDLAPRDENGEQEASILWPYDKMLTRVYQRADGQIVMFALAWGSKQRQEIKVHRPELCYASQGLQVVDHQLAVVNLSDQTGVRATRLVTKNLSRLEPVTYWIRIGDTISMSAWQSRVRILTEGLKGRIPDGILVRVSQAVPTTADPNSSFRVQESFLKDLFLSVDHRTQLLLAGNGLRGG